MDMTNQESEARVTSFQINQVSIEAPDRFIAISVEINKQQSNLREAQIGATQHPDEPTGANLFDCVAAVPIGLIDVDRSQ
jgi:hypothetical protein